MLGMAQTAREGVVNMAETVVFCLIVTLGAASGIVVIAYLGMAIDLL